MRRPSVQIPFEFFPTFPVSSFFSSIGNVPKIRFYSSRSKSKISSKINIFWEKKSFFEQDSSRIKCSVKWFCFLICLKTLILQPFVVFIVLIFTNLTHYVKSTSQNFFLASIHNFLGVFEKITTESAKANCNF